MHKIKLRTKIEAVFLVSLLVVLSTAGVLAVTRTISDTQDNVYSLIRNTNGNIWDVSQANLQAAINDLNNASGMVWVGSDFSASDTTIVHNNITVDLWNHKITYSGTGHCVQLRRGSRIENGCIDVSGITMNNDKAAIYVDGSDRINMKDSQVQATGASHMTLIGNAVSQSGTGVFLNSNSTTMVQEVNLTSWDDITTSFFYYAYRLEAWGEGNPGVFVNSNTFIGCYDDTSVISYYLHQKTSLSHSVCGVDGNQFQNCITQASSSSPAHHSDYGVYCEGQNNYFKVMFWDWNGGIEPAYFGTNAKYNVIIGPDKDEITDVNEPNSSNIYFCVHDGEIYAESWTQH
jgi:hypothetical protein